jgi:hypothetical protein
MKSGAGLSNKKQMLRLHENFWRRMKLKMAAEQYKKASIYSATEVCCQSSLQT